MGQSSVTSAVLLLLNAASIGADVDPGDLSSGNSKLFHLQISIGADSIAALRKEPRQYVSARVQEGKTRREANRCLKRYLARNLYRLLEHPPPSPT